VKLNQECVRDLLLYLEEKLQYNSRIIINDLKLKSYSKDDLMYTADKLTEAQYINTIANWNMSSSHIIAVESITYQGHQYIDSIRDDNIWKEAKSKFSKLASVSLPVIQELATSIAKSKLGLQ
jgi:hypothetical protein